MADGRADPPDRPRLRERPDPTDQPRPPRAPGDYPIVGHTLAFLREPLRSLERWGGVEESVVRVRIAGRRICLLTDPAPVREVLATGADDYRKADVVSDRLGTLQGGSLVLLEGEAWRERREMLGSAFTPERVADTGSVATDYAAAMVDDWPTDRAVRADRRARDLSLSILARTLFGLDLRGSRTPIHAAADDVMARLDVQSPATYLPEWVPTRTNRRFRRAVATLHDRLDEVVERRAEAPAEGEAPGAAGEPSGDLLSTMLAAGVPTERVRDELIAFLFAGFDSTATALSCTIALLGDHPDVQDRLHRELDRELGGATPTPSILEALPLLRAVVRESLRLYPPQYVLFREPTDPVTLGGFRIDPGTTVVAPPWVLHRDPRFWSAPTQFRPARWLDDESTGTRDGSTGTRDGSTGTRDGSTGTRDGSTVDAGGGQRGTDRPEYAYVPYGSGPRHCLGARLADQTLQLVVAVLCQHRRLELTGDLSVSAGPTLSLDDGIEVHARPHEE